MNPAGGSPTVPLADLVAYLDRLLEVDAVSDYGPNGLQVEGRSEVAKVVTGVSACHELFVRARQAGADCVMVHHGLFWDGLSPVLTGVHYRRVAELVRAGISLLAYHLPLDRHPELGNNALAARALGLEELAPFAEHQGVTIGFAGTYPQAITFADFLQRCDDLFGQKPQSFGDRERPVRTVGMVSGGAQRELHQAIAAGLDVFVTGEASEWVVNLARESGVRYVAAGHYATERLGIRALGEHVGERFGVEVEFVDVPNPV